MSVSYRRSTKGTSLSYSHTVSVPDLVWLANISGLLEAYLLVSAVNDVVGLRHESDLQQKCGLKPGGVSVNFCTRDSGVLMTEEGEEPEEPNHNGGKL